MMSAAHYKIRGFSLPELAVSVFLLGVLLLLAIGAFVPGLKVVQQAEQDTAAEREVVLAFERLMSEMSLLDRISVVAQNGCLSYLGRLPFNGSNPALASNQVELFNFYTPELPWTKFVVLKLRDGQLWRREFPYNAGGDQRRLARIVPSELLAVADHSPSQEKIFAKNIELFQCDVLGRSRVRVRMRSVFRQGKLPESCDMTFDIAMRGTNG